MTLFDTHAHYYDEKFGSDSERREVIGKIRQAGVKYVINAGTNPDSSRLSLALADEYDGVYAAVGLHPEDIFDISDPEAAFSEIRELEIPGGARRVSQLQRKPRDRPGAYKARMAYLVFRGHNIRKRPPHGTDRHGNTGGQTAYRDRLPVPHPSSVQGTEK